MDDVTAQRLERRKAERSRKNDARLFDLRQRMRSEAYEQGIPLVLIGTTNSGGRYVSIDGRGHYGGTSFAANDRFAMKHALRRLPEGQRYRLIVERMVDGMRREEDHGILVATPHPPSPRRRIAERFAALIAETGFAVGLPPEVLLHDDQDRGYRCSFSSYPREVMDRWREQWRAKQFREAHEAHEDGLIGWVYVEAPEAIRIQATNTVGGQFTLKARRFSSAADAEAALRLLLVDLDFEAFSALYRKPNAASTA